MKEFWPVLGMILGVCVFLVFVAYLGGKEIFKFRKGGEEKMIEGKKILLVLAPTNFRDEEYQKPKEVLEKAKAKIVVASKGVSEAVGMFGTKAKVDQDLSSVMAGDYDAIVFVGGAGTTVYFNDKTALTLAKSAYEKGKVVGAICIAPSILANAGILNGKKATSFPSEETNLKEKGANYTGDAVSADGKIVTAKGPEAAEEFGKEIVNLLSQ